MPLYGALDVAALTAPLPRMTDLDTEAWTLPDAEILQLSWEVGEDPDRKSTRLNSSHIQKSRMPSSA